MPDPLTVIVLAAGKGTRMRSERPKVLHPLAGRTLIEHVLTHGGGAGAGARRRGPGARTWTTVAAEVGARPAAGGDRAAGAAARHRPRAAGGARRSCRATGEVLVLYGDTPLVTAGDARSSCWRRGARPAPRSRCSAFARPTPPATAASPSTRPGLAAIVEERHADAALKREGVCNAGIMAFDAARLGRCSTRSRSSSPRASTI